MFVLTQLQYNTLKVAIPKNWRIILSEGIDISGNFCSNYDNFCTEVKISSRMHKILNSDSSKIEALNLVWRTNLSDPTIDMIIQFERLCKVTNYMKFHSLKFRFLHNEIGFNKQLKLWKVKNNG